MSVGRLGGDSSCQSTSTLVIWCTPQLVPTVAPEPPMPMPWIPPHPHPVPSLVPVAVLSHADAGRILLVERTGGERLTEDGRRASAGGRHGVVAAEVVP